MFLCYRTCTCFHRHSRKMYEKTAEKKQLKPGPLGPIIAPLLLCKPSNCFATL